MKNIFLVLGLLISLNSWGKMFDESGPGNGTDYVKVLFAEAHSDLKAAIERIRDQDISALPLSPEVIEWLLTETVHMSPENKPLSRWARVKIKIKSMDIRFQQTGCSDYYGKRSSICYYDLRNKPFIVVSLQENRQTSKNQAMAMLIHEAGHLVGEYDHLLLDKIGADLVKFIVRPGLFVSDMQKIDNTYQDTALAKKECEQGNSSMAKSMAIEVKFDAAWKCFKKGYYDCDGANVLLYYNSIVLEISSGVNAQAAVICQVRGILATSH